MTTAEGSSQEPTPPARQGSRSSGNIPDGNIAAGGIQDGGVQCGSARTRSRRWAWGGLAVVLAGGLGLRLWGIRQGLPYAYNAD